jgi:hypothetical protein
MLFPLESALEKRPKGAREQLCVILVAKVLEAELNDDRRCLNGYLLRAISMS